VFENKVQRRLFGSNREEVTRGWRKLHNEELHNLCSSTGTKSKKIKLLGNSELLQDNGGPWAKYEHPPPPSLSLKERFYSSIPTQNVFILTRVED
jgi:hypothetical protein